MLTSILQTLFVVVGNNSHLEPMLESSYWTTTKSSTIAHIQLPSPCLLLLQTEALVQGLVDTINTRASDQVYSIATKAIADAMVYLPGRMWRQHQW